MSKIKIMKYFFLFFFLRNMMNFFACKSVILEKECGTVAMDVYVDILQKIGPGVVAGCGNSRDLLPAVIRLYKLEEEKEKKHY